MWPYGAVSVYRITQQCLSKQAQIILNSSWRICSGNYHNRRKCGAVHFLRNNCKTNMKREPASTVQQALSCVKKYFQKVWGLGHWKAVLKSHSFHWHVQNAMMPCCSEGLLPFLSVIYPFLPPTSLPSSLTSSYHLFLGLPLSLVASKFIYNTFFGNSVFFHSLYMPKPT